MSEIIHSNQSDKVDTTELATNIFSDEYWREFAYAHAISLARQYAGGIALEGMPRIEVDGVE